MLGTPTVDGQKMKPLTKWGPPGLSEKGPKFLNEKPVMALEQRECIVARGDAYLLQTSTSHTKEQSV